MINAQPQQKAAGLTAESTDPNPKLSEQSAQELFVGSSFFFFFFRNEQFRVGSKFKSLNTFLFEDMDDF